MKGRLGKSWRWTGQAGGQPATDMEHRSTVTQYDSLPASTMDSEMHALAILEAAESWNWPVSTRDQASGKFSGKFKAITPKLLSAAIIESQALGGTLLDQFWVVVGRCHPRLAQNSRSRFRIPLSEHIFQLISLSSYNPSAHALFITSPL